MSKQLNSRVSHKHDTEANWLKATSFVPLAGEQIIYDADDTHPLPRVKIGDGTTLVSDLPFAVKNTTPNWKASEGEDGYIENRTHWMDESFVEIVPTTTLTGDNGSFVHTAESALDIGENRLYRVHFNGTAYDSLAKTVSADETDFILLGNYGLILDGTDTGEPFVCLTMAEDTSTLSFEIIDETIYNANTFDFSIHEIVQTYHKLPSAYTYQPDWAAGVTENGHVLNRTHWEEPSVVIHPFAEDEQTSSAEGVVFYTPVKDLVAGGRYLVTWNGNKYDCVAEAIYTESFIIALGNLPMFFSSGDNGYPFFIFQEGSGTSIHACSVYEDKTLIQFALNEYEVHKLPERFVNKENADWNAFYGEPGYIENRTHWETQGGVVLLDDTFNALDMNLHTSPIGLKAGETYIVTYEGVEYECVAKETTLLGKLPAVYIGDIDNYLDPPFAVHDLLQPASGVIFGYDAPIYGGVSAKYDANTDDDSTREIKVVSKGTIKKLDEKFLPEYNWDASSYESGHILNRTHYSYSFSPVRFDSAAKDEAIAIEYADSSKMYMVTDQLISADDIGLFSVYLTHKTTGERIKINMSQSSNELNFPNGEAEFLPGIFGFSPIEDPDAVSAGEFGLMICGRAGEIHDSTSSLSFTVETPGIYIVQDGFDYIFEMSIDGDEYVKKLDAKYLPEMVEEVTDEELLEALKEADLLLCVEDNGSIITDENNNILGW